MVALMKKILTAVAALILLQACGSVGNVQMKEQSESTINLTKGKTTRQKWWKDLAFH